MKITKFGHCCLLIEQKGLRMITDPGIYSTIQNEIKDLDLVLFTHEHADHFHLESLKKILENNSNIKIIANKSVAEILEKENISFNLIKDGDKIEERGVLIEGFGERHAVMHSSIPASLNTGFFIDNIFFYPGDSFTDPNKQVEILALPVAGPWMKLSEAIDYAIEINPKVCFPVHDGILKSPGVSNSLPLKILSDRGINFCVPEIGEEMVFTNFSRNK